MSQQYHFRVRFWPVTTMDNELEHKLARNIGHAVLQAAEHYERATGKRAYSILIRVTEGLTFPPDPLEASDQAITLNFSSISYSVEVIEAARDSEKK